MRQIREVSLSNMAVFRGASASLHACLRSSKSGRFGVDELLSALIASAARMSAEPRPDAECPHLLQCYRILSRLSRVISREARCISFENLSSPAGF